MATFVTVGKGRCRLLKQDGFRMLMCSGRGWTKEVGPTDVIFDPTLSRAEFTAQIKGVTHTVAWTAEDLGPTTGVYTEAGPHGAGAAVGMYRYMTAAGEVFGTGLEHDDRWDFADVAQGGGLFVGTPVVASYSNGRFEFRARV